MTWTTRRVPGSTRTGDVVDDRIAIVAHAVLGRNLVILHAGGRKRRADANLFLVAVGRHALGHHILAELRLLLIGQAAHDGARHAAHGSTDRAADDGAADGTGGSAGRSAARLGEGADRGEGDKNSACKQDLLGHVSAPRL